MIKRRQFLAQLLVILSIVLTGAIIHSGTNRCDIEYGSSGVHFTGADCYSDRSAP